MLILLMNLSWLPRAGGGRKDVHRGYTAESNWTINIPAVHGPTTTSIKLETLVEGR